MPDLSVRIKKNKDGSASLACVRRDGSSTWQRQEGDDGFYGLIASGWEISDFAMPWPRGPIPAEARQVEVLVGALDLDRMTGQRRSLVEFNEQVRFSAARDPEKVVAPRELTAEELARIRERLSELFAQWAAVEPGSTLELPFDRSVVRTST